MTSFRTPTDRVELNLPWDPEAAKRTPREATNSWPRNLSDYFDFLKSFATAVVPSKPNRIFEARFSLTPKTPGPT